ncbi:steryl ester hydrolase, putative [Plasmodium berghei]|uniref:Steryl ester hydrolase, putative n=2 Tax=Plasmodium berghei TaxID=5821 RepID=A0A509AIL9_PLABA|nr:steryl ester hydrolase, putative [Plasmodium berghei ANKA]CXI42916.1 steryl ester hydrolase, putative [Plasmodium berghei]SCM22212.1 steryl ester hydrolase, putative [Plasmodium berghei]SCN25337.1 steryl ester hydrolase, putative [Plasmodium berghei]SCO60309.1 steryl ester hydrolase, putative [Plasmodium berghei]SCO62008.1 steryl ester hydrolase, putative [Plasmodium berghei]|eukprot:XP_034421568.1 steryl ester hydrolase, putative [Plasmodium berghei ANKA]
MALYALNDGLPVINVNISTMFNEVNNETYNFDFISGQKYYDSWRSPLPYEVFNKLEDLDDMEKIVHDITDGDFKAEKHHVYTIDGYKLNLYHITDSDKNYTPLKKKSLKKGVFCIGHGLMESSINAISGGYDSLPFKLLLKNYDIWLCNNRGNYLTEYVGKKYAMKKNLERYTIEDLRDIGFDESTYSKNLEYDKIDSKKKKKKFLEKLCNKQDKNKDESKPNPMKRKFYIKNNSCLNKKEMNNTNLQKKAIKNNHSDYNKNGIDSKVDMTSKSQINNDKKSNDNVQENINDVEIKYLKSMLPNSKLFTSEDINVKKIYELVGITENDLKYLDDMKKEDIEKNIKEIDKWTFEDLGKNDIPAIIKYIKSKTKQDKIMYIGLSQGSISLLIGGCLNPYVNNSIDRCYLMSLPIILWKKSEIFFALKGFILASKHFKKIIKLRNYAMKYIPQKLMKYLIINLSHFLTSNILKFVRNDICNKDIIYLNTPSGSNSTANIHKWLSSFDKGPVTDIFEKNSKNCTFPICLIYGDRDCLVDSNASIEYMQKLFKDNEMQIIKKNEWSHLDPMIADDEDIVFSHIMKDIKKDKSKNNNT